MTAKLKHMKQFTANRLSGGNRLFPAEIHIDNFGVTLKVPGIFNGEEKSLGADQGGAEQF